MIDRGLRIISIIKVDLKAFLLRPKWLSIIFAFCLLSYFSISESFAYSFNLKLEYNLYDILFDTLINQYYILYLFIPLILAITFPVITSIFNPLILVRVSSRTDWILAKVIVLFIHSVLFVFIGVIVTFLMGISFFPYENVWSQSTLEMKEAISFIPKELVQNFKSPIVSLLIGLILLTLGLGTFCVLTTVLYIVFKHVVTSLTITFGVLALSLVAMRMYLTMSYFAFLFPSTNMIITHAMKITHLGVIISITFFIVVNSILLTLGIRKFLKQDLTFGGNN